MKTLKNNFSSIGHGTKNGRAILLLYFEYNHLVIAEVKKLHGHWSKSLQCWYIYDIPPHRELLELPPKLPVGKEVLQRIHPNNQSEMKLYHETLIMKGYSVNTIKTYLVEFAQLLYILNSRPANELDPNQIRAYILYCHQKLKLSNAVIHSRINAIKFYYNNVLERNYTIEIPRPQKPYRLPKVLDTKEILKIFNATQNPKHRLMLQLCYGMGLRVSEIVTLKIENINSKRMQVLIQNAKGAKDRYVNLPEFILEPMREYYKTYKPKVYLFEGQSQEHYSQKRARSF